jgi:uracil-DNA glycosylase
MSLEQQLHFDISRCSYCPLGANQIFCTPTINQGVEFFLVLDSPNLNAAEENNGWRHPGANFLTKAISFASGQSLSMFHLTFLMKCHCQILGTTPSLKDKKAWGRTCASHYLEWEFKGLKPRKVLFFGEVATSVCFPDNSGPWTNMIGQSLTLNPYGIEAHVFESPSSISNKGGIESDEGIDYIKRLHSVLGGKLTLPDIKEESSLFDFFN